MDDININKSRKKTGGTIKYMYFIVKYISELLNLLYITVYTVNCDLTNLKNWFYFFI